MRRLRTPILQPQSRAILPADRALAPCVSLGLFPCPRNPHASPPNPLKLSPGYSCAVKTNANTWNSVSHRTQAIAQTGLDCV
jgi:hypothetical protein